MSSAAEMFSAAEMLLAAGAVKRSQQGLPRSGRFLTRTGHFSHRSLTGILSCQCPFLVPRPVPRWTRAITPGSVSFRRLLSFSSWQAPSASQKTKITRRSIVGRGLAVLPEQKCGQTRKDPQSILSVWSRGSTQYGRISARQNRVYPCSWMVSTP